jgi:hypothetical protein
LKLSSTSTIKLSRRKFTNEFSTFVLIQPETKTHNMDAPQKIQPAAKERKSQPWKKVWPPQTKEVPGEKHGFAKGEMLQLGGQGGTVLEPLKERN